MEVSPLPTCVMNPKLRMLIALTIELHEKVVWYQDSGPSFNGVLVSDVYRMLLASLG